MVQIIGAGGASLPHATCRVIVDPTTTTPSILGNAEKFVELAAAYIFIALFIEAKMGCKVRTQGFWGVEDKDIPQQMQAGMKASDMEGRAMRGTKH